VVAPALLAVVMMQSEAHFHNAGLIAELHVKMPAQTSEHACSSKVFSCLVVKVIKIHAEKRAMDCQLA
jgi:hypothetical protein